MHNTAKSIENSLRGEVLGGDEVNEVLLAFLFLLQGLVKERGQGARGGIMVNLFDDVEDGGVSLAKVG